MPIIIYGWRGITSDLESGEFTCLHCGRASGYRLRQVRRFATLFWIPLFPISGAVRFVECEQCGSRFQEEVLSLTPAAVQEATGQEATGADRVLLVAHDELLDGVSVGKVQAKMVELGYDPARVEAVLMEMCDGKPKKCTCGRQYHPKVQECAECGERL